MTKGLVIFFLVLSLGACTLGPNYTRPDLEIPSSWRLEEREAKETVNTPWWEQFHDPVLNQLITIALKENKEIRLAASRVEEFLGRYGLARSGSFPQAGAVALGQRKNVTQYSNPPWPATADNLYNDYQTLLNASWEIDFWGRLRRTREAAQADLLGTQEGKRTVILTVVTAAALAYTDLLDLDKQLQIARRTVESRRDSFNLFKLRFERGLIAELELRQIESEVQSALATVSALQKAIGQQENNLQILLGRNPGPVPRGKTLDSLILPPVPAGLPSQLLERRPDIRRAEQDLIAANARIGVAKALYFPTLSLTGFLGLQSTDLSLLFSGAARTLNFTTSLTAPIFSAGGLAGAVKVSEAVQQQALIRYQQVIQTAFREVEDALIDQARTRDQWAAQKKQVEALKAYLELARLRYENGYTSYLEVLDAERGLFNAELAFTQTQGILFRALVHLYKAMGGGWVMEADRLAGRG